MSPFEGRPLNPLERNLLHLDRVTRFSFVVIAQGHGRLGQDVLRAALSYVQGQHFYLNVRLPAVEPPVFDAPAPEIPIRVVADAAPDRWLQEAEVELNTAFDLARGPLARVVWLDRGEAWDLVFAFEHLSSDGVSGSHFAREVIAACGDLALGWSLPPVVPQGGPFPDLASFPEGVFGVRGALKALSFVGRLGWDEIRTRSTRGPSPAWVPFDARDVRLDHHAWSEEETTRLVGACRAAGTTVQGALGASLLLELAEILRRDANVPAPRIHCVSSVNARPHCRGSVPDHHMGLWVGQVVRSYGLPPTLDFWTLARSVTRDLRRDLSSDRMFVPYRLLFRKIWGDGERFVRSFENGHPYVEVTNVGQLNFENGYGPFTLDALHFASGLQFTQATPWGLTVAATTFAGRLHTNLHFLARYWDAETARRTSARILGRLQAVGQVLGAP